jgi:hypothetical protein
MKLTSPFSGCNGHAARLILPRRAPHLGQQFRRSATLSSLSTPRRGNTRPRVHHDKARSRRQSPLSFAAQAARRPRHGSNTSLTRSTPWHFAGSGGRDVALGRDKVSRAAWPLNLEKGDVSFMGVARRALGRAAGRARIAAAQRPRWEQFRRSNPMTRARARARTCLKTRLGSNPGNKQFVGHSQCRLLPLCLGYVPAVIRECLVLPTFPRCPLLNVRRTHRWDIGLTRLLWGKKIARHSPRGGIQRVPQPSGPWSRGSKLPTRHGLGR